MRTARILVCLAALVISASLIALAQGRGGGRQNGAPPAADRAGAGWTTYGGNLASHRYSPLDQINRDNFKNLRIAWRLKTNSLGSPENLFSVTPLYVDGALYTTAGSRRTAIALDPGTGETLWMHTEDEGPRGDAAPRKGSGRGLAYWSSADGADRRIIYVTPGYRMIALDARTGEPVRSFGTEGAVDLKMENDQEYDNITTATVGLNATPLVAGDVVIVGAAHFSAGSPNSRPSAKGYVRGFDVKTGKRLWIFHTIPVKGEVGYDTWLDGSAERNGNLGAWAQMSADVDLGLVYVPTEMPASDYYGVNRPGAGLFGESIVALDIKTGKRKWHYQTVHHGLWDWDLPCAPILYDAQIGGRTIKALAQPTKSAFLFVLNRETGEPVWPIEERAVPQSDVPGEKTSPTQPFPTRPLPFDRQGVTTDDLIDFTPALRAQALEQASAYKLGPIFTPPGLATPGGPMGTLMLPSEVGGTNWPGGSFDPETNRLYIHSHTVVFNLPNVAQDLSMPGPTNTAGLMRGAQPSAAAPAGESGGRGNPAGQRGGRGGPAGERGGRGNPAGQRGGRGDAAGERGGRGNAAGERGGRGDAAGRGGGAPARGGARGGTTVQGLPLIKPPYDRITAYDMNTGAILWQKTHSSTPDNIKNNAALKGLDLPRLGQPGRTFIGVLTTKALVIAGEGGVHTNAQGQTVALLRAYDKFTGADIPGEVNMPAKQTGSPMSYMHNGKQYIVIAVSGQGNAGAELLAYALP
jgi:quinoprotein glucose dehydrogenase